MFIIEHVLCCYSNQILQNSFMAVHHIIPHTCKLILHWTGSWRDPSSYKLEFCRIVVLERQLCITPPEACYSHVTKIYCLQKWAWQQQHFRVVLTIRFCLADVNMPQLQLYIIPTISAKYSQRALLTMKLLMNISCCWKISSIPYEGSCAQKYTCLTGSYYCNIFNSLEAFP